MKIKALPNKVLVTDLERGARIINGIIIPDDNGKSEGIRPRWGRVYSVGEGVTEIEEGQWILIEHGRWTRTINIKDDLGNEVKVWGVEWPNAVLVASDQEPETAIFSKWA